MSKYLQNFFKQLQGSSTWLVMALLAALLLANSRFSANLSLFLSTEIGFSGLNLSLQHWINDGLMAVFFLMVGLEIKREILEGELSDPKKASLPIFGAIGGMLFPALIFYAFNFNGPFAKAWAIPTATDIAFSLAVISLLGKRVPLPLKIFLTALAIVDDLGAIAIIALFYANQIKIIYLLYALLVILILIFFNFKQRSSLWYYLLPAPLLWYFVHHSGIHASIAGVMLAMCVPTNLSKSTASPLEKLEKNLHWPVSFIIMPIFAFANTNIQFRASMVDELLQPLSLGIIAGLVLGKTIGINFMAWLSIKLKWAQMPNGSRWQQLWGVGFLAGIGFTMSVFMAIMAIADSRWQDQAKFSILLASLLSGFIGFLLLKRKNQ